MKIALVQMQAVAGDVAANLKTIETAAAEAAAGGADLLVAPELAITGYGAGEAIRDLAEPVDGAGTDGAVTVVSTDNDDHLLAFDAEGKTSNEGPYVFFSPAGPKRLLAVVDRADLTGAGPDEPAAPLGTLGGRVAHAGDDLASTWAAMADAGRRRVAVVDDAGRLLGLLCLKRHGRGFCSDAGIQARIDERAAAPDGP